MWDRTGDLGEAQKVKSHGRIESQKLVESLPHALRHRSLLKPYLRPCTYVLSIRFFSHSQMVEQIESCAEACWPALRISRARIVRETAGGLRANIDTAACRPGARIRKMVSQSMSKAQLLIIKRERDIDQA